MEPISRLLLCFTEKILMSTLHGQLEMELGCSRRLHSERGRWTIRKRNLSLDHHPLSGIVDPNRRQLRQLLARPLRLGRPLPGQLPGLLFDLVRNRTITASNERTVIDSRVTLNYLLTETLIFEYLVQNRFRITGARAAASTRSEVELLAIRPGPLKLTGSDLCETASGRTRISLVTLRAGSAILAGDTILAVLTGISLVTGITLIARSTLRTRHLPDRHHLIASLLVTDEITNDKPGENQQSQTQNQYNPTKT